MSDTYQNTLDCSAILRVELFSTLLEEDHRVVVTYSGFLQLRKRGLLFAAGQRAGRFFLLLEGNIRVYKPGPKERQDEVARFAAGDEARIRVAQILKNFSRKLGRGWPLRFKSNETSLYINKCGPRRP